MTGARAALAVIGAVAATLALAGGAGASTSTAEPAADLPRGAERSKPLAGLVIALDPGHQLGNSNPAFFDRLSQTRFNGVITKGCNTSGTATSSGYPESTFNFDVARKVRKRLVALGATVRSTRTTNSWNRWGPCVWKRGAFGARVGADLTVSIHADGSATSHSGFFVMVPGVVPGWTDDIAGPSQRMGAALIRGMADAGAPRANYIGGQTLVTNTISTLNFSDVPIVLVELGNMKNPGDAARMMSPDGRTRYARWLVAGIRAALGR